jgi:PKD repeat protein
MRGQKRLRHKLMYFAVASALGAIGPLVGATSATTTNPVGNPGAETDTPDWNTIGSGLGAASFRLTAGTTGADALMYDLPDWVALSPANTAPVAALTVTPATGTVPLAVTADASASTDGQGNIASYSFNFGDGTVLRQ